MAEMAKEVCRCCPVAQECLDYALDSGEKFGIWEELVARAQPAASAEAPGGGVGPSAR